MKLPFTPSLLLLPVFLLSCAHDAEKKEGQRGKNDTAVYMAKPSDPHLSHLKLEEQLSKEIRQSLSVASDTLVEEAAVVVAETRNALRYLLANKTAAAEQSMERA